ncbi:MAG: hypothetical protein FWC12_12845 [Treponema sp.]|nr:hypothetical protein [Treponema sp.]
MSEFSCSYHLKTENINDCIDLVKKANVSGFLFPMKNGWVSFVIDEPDFKFSKKLIDANDGVLLNFINAEDHGWSFEIFNKNDKVCRFECDYTKNNDCFYEKCIENRDCIFDDAQCKVLEKIFSIEKNEVIKNDANEFAIGMGLNFYEWVSYDYISRDFESFSEYKIIKIKKKKEKNSGVTKKTNVSKVPIFQWIGGHSPWPITGKAEKECNKEGHFRKTILPVGETFYTSLEFVNAGKACKGITIIIIGKSFENENIDIEKIQFFNGYAFEGNNAIMEGKPEKAVFQNGMKGYLIKFDNIEIVHSISYSEEFEIFKKTQVTSKKFHRYTIKILARAVNKPDIIEAFVFVHPNENLNEGYFCEDLFRDQIVFK